MSIKSILTNILKYLNIQNYEISGKRKSLNNLLERLNIKKLNLHKTIKSELDKANIDKLKEELKIVSLYIDKSNNALNRLNTAR